MTLIQVNGETILIDTAFINEGNVGRPNITRNARHVTAAFARYDHHLEDVQEIFITHWHHDHFGNIGLFPMATVRFAGLNRKRVERTLANFNMSNACAEIPAGTEWLEGVSILPTPGHNVHHQSLIITWEDLTIVIAGDAIVANPITTTTQFGLITPISNPNGSRTSPWQKLKSVADIIIPGNGPPFENYLRGR